MPEWSSASDRMRVFLDAVGTPVPESGSRTALRAAVAERLVAGAADELWLALAVLRADLPTVDMVTEYRRALSTQKPNDVVKRILNTAVRSGLRRQVPKIHVVSGATVVDAHHTARTRLATGIQRVVRKTLQVWASEHEVVLVGWSVGYRGMRELTADERGNALYGSQPHSHDRDSPALAVPWRSTYILPELAVEPDRSARISALAEYSGNDTVVIGYDCVPFTTAETTAPGMPSAFARNLTALSRFDKIAAISVAAASEYSGWRHMLAGIGLDGPDVREILLAAEPESVSESAIESARSVLLVGDLPLLLCVGSHEPRKNHLAVLHAAELLWRSGRSFSLTFVGGNSWGSDDFKRQLVALQDAGRPIQSISAITDELLWSAYRIATCTVFPSLNEGFGLPVAESISVGTPVVTSNFGSMAEIAERGGAILVDPRDDQDVMRGIEVGLFDEDARARLTAEATASSPRPWAMYATELWDYAHSDVTVARP